MNPWDKDRLWSNLTTLAELQEEDRLIPAGPLGYFDNTRLSTHVPKQTCDEWMRTDAVNRYEEPLKRVFEQALLRRYRLSQEPGHEVTDELIRQAFAGLRRLVELYHDRVDRLEGSEKDYVNKEYLAAYKVRRTVESILNKQRDTDLAEAGNDEKLAQLYKRYCNHVVFKVNQKLYDVGRGVCHAFCVDWFRRRLLAGKVSYRMKKGKDMRVIADHERMKGKVDKRIRNAQEDPRVTTGKGFQAYIIKETETKYAGLGFLTIFVRKSPQYVPGDKGPISGFTLPWLDIVNEAEATRDKLADREIFYYSPQSPNGLASLQADPTDCYYLALDPPRRAKKRDGHVMGLYLQPQGFIHFFDPNAGEFFFRTKEQFAEFMKDLTTWAGYDQFSSCTTKLVFTPKKDATYE